MNVSQRLGSPPYVMNPKLIEYIRTQTMLGKTPEEIFRVLQTQGGWTKDEINVAFASVRAERKIPEIAMVREEYHPLATETIKISNAPIEVKSAITVKPKLHLSLRTTIFLVVAFVLLAASATYGYFVYLPTMNQPSLNEALPQIASSTAALSSASYIGSFHATGTFSYMEKAEVKLPEGSLTSTTSSSGSTRVKGSFDLQLPFSFSYIKAGSANENDIKLQGRIEPYIAFSMLPLSFVASATSSFIVADKTFYARLDNISEIMLIPFDFSQLTGVWVRLPLNEEINEEILASSSVAYKQALARALKEKVIKVTDTLPGELIGGVNTYRYRFQVDVGKLSTIIAEEVSKESPDIPANIDRDLALMPPLWGDLWIDRDSLALRRLLISYRVSTTTPIDADTITEFDTTLSFTIERENAIASTILAPKDSVTQKELMDKIRFNTLLKDLNDTSTTTEAAARILWSNKTKLMEKYPEIATTSRSYRRYPANACKEFGLSTSCRIGTPSSFGNTFVLWANVGVKRILCVDGEEMVVLSKPLKATEYRCPLSTR